MSVHYDEAIIRKFAQQLYNRANFIIVLCILVGGAGGFLVGGALGERGSVDNALAIFAVIGALIGAAIGTSLAFKYKLQAQVALCQVKIEKNTRRG